MKPFNFHSTKSIICQAGSLEQIGSICASLNIKRPVIITDAGIVSCGLMERLATHFTATSHAIEYIVFDKVKQDPDEETIAQALLCAKRNQADGVIGFGGGSPMDTAKLVAVLSISNQVLDDMYGIDKITGSRLPMILIPTTAGTGSEVTPISIVTTGVTKKTGVVGDQLLPDVALLDATLTLNLPMHITAATGIDAMVHAIEAFTGKIKKNIYSDMLAIQALKLLSENIKTSVFDGNNIEARQAMLLGACLAGQAFANSPVAAVHALAYPLGGHFQIPHGLSNALVLPFVMRFNASHCVDLYAQIARNILPDLVSENTNDIEAAEKLITHIEQLILSLGLPSSLAAVNIEHSDLDLLAKDAMRQTRLLVNNPKALSEKDALNIYQQAFIGL